DRWLVDSWKTYARRQGITQVGMAAAAVLGALALALLLLKVDTWTRGYYSTRLFLGVPAAIIAVILLEVLIYQGFGNRALLARAARFAVIMPIPARADVLLVEAIRRGKPEAWTDLIAQYEGRLLSFVDSRLRRRSASEDVVQETFIGFLTSLPNYDSRRPLESWLFTIASHKLTDHLRREGRRPAIPLSSADGSGGNWEPP